MSRIILILTALVSLVFLGLLVHSGKTKKQAEVNEDAENID